jgi:hypothetical protein
MRKVQHFQRCGATTIVAVDVGILVEAEGEFAKLLDVAWARHDRLTGFDVGCNFSLVVGTIDPNVRIDLSLVM